MYGSSDSKRVISKEDKAASKGFTFDRPRPQQFGPFATIDNAQRYKLSIKPTITDRCYTQSDFEEVFEYLRRRGLKIATEPVLRAYENDSRGLLHFHGVAWIEGSKPVRTGSLMRKGWHIYISGYFTSYWEDYLRKESSIHTSVKEQVEAKRYYRMKERFTIDCA